MSLTARDFALIRKVRLLARGSKPCAIVLHRYMFVMHLLGQMAVEEPHARTHPTLQRTTIQRLAVQDIVLKAGQLLLAKSDANEDSPGGRQMKVSSVEGKLYMLHLPPACLSNFCNDTTSLVWLEAFSNAQEKSFESAVVRWPAY